MKLVTFLREGRTSPGVWLDEGVVDLSLAADLAGEEIDATSLLTIIDGGEAALETVRKLARDCSEKPYAHDAVQLLAPIPLPRRNVFCIGRNYMDHVAEGDRARGVQATKVPEFPQIFTKSPQTVNRPGGEVPYFTKVTSRLDYEVELALVIGKAGRDIAKADAYDHILGYTIANDVSARDLQRRHEQWFKGKSLDGSLPLGPWIVTKDEIGDPTTLELSLTLNGDERQRAKVSSMIFDIPAIIEQLSAGMTLLPGDIIATGTPAGVGFAMDPPGLMKVGDTVVCTIDRIGSLTNTIVEVV